MELTVWEAATGKEKPLTVPPQGYLNLQFAPSGSHLLAWTGNRIEVWDVSTGKLCFHGTFQPEPGKPFGIRALAFSRDGRRLAYSLQDGQLLLLDSASVRNSSGSGSFPARRPACSVQQWPAGRCRKHERSDPRLSCAGDDA